MKKVFLGVFLVMTCAIVVHAPAPALASETGLTVGEFLDSIARAKQISIDDYPDATAALRDTGVRLPALALDEPLTEGDVAAIARALGFKVTTSSPDAPFSRQQAETFVAAFGRELGASPSSSMSGPDSSGEGARNSNGSDPLTKGKGKKKGLLKRSPSEPV